MRQSCSKFWTILLVALLLRVVVAIAIEQRVTAAGRTFLIEGDANGYWELAQHLAAGHDAGCQYQDLR